MTTVESVSSRRGDFRVRARRSPRYVKPNCTACGDCAKAADMVYDGGLNVRHAVEVMVNGAGLNQNIVAPVKPIEFARQAQKKEAA